MNTFISYAQNLEDVMLWRALRHVSKGFYIDVGAHDPVHDSVTKAFYERGWNGINLEPCGQYFQLLYQDRPRDTNLHMAVGSEEVEIEFYEFENTGLSTSDRRLADTHKSSYALKSTTVRCITLDALFRRYVSEVVHFLKIDVEGAEAAVLAGFNLKKFRPWIVVVEATKPLSNEGSGINFQSLIGDKGYHHAYFDGINRFYVANERSELMELFSYPPNVLDHFVRHSEYEAQLRVQRLEQEMAFLLNGCQTELAECTKKVKKLTNEIQLIKESRSWRWMAPLRKLGGLFRRYR